MTLNHKGEYVRKVTAETNDRTQREVLLTCKVRLLEPFYCEPSTVDFDFVDRDAGSVKKTIKLVRGDGGPLNPELLPPRNKQLSAHLREIEHGEKYELDVEFGPPWPARAMRTTIEMRTGVPEAPESHITVQARFSPRLRADPPRFRIPGEREGETELKARLIWAGADAGKITRAMVNETSLRVRVDDEDGHPTVVLTVPANYERKTIAFVTVLTDDPTMRILRLPIMPPSGPHAASDQDNADEDGSNQEGLPPPPGERFKDASP